MTYFIIIFPSHSIKKSNIIFSNIFNKSFLIFISPILNLFRCSRNIINNLLLNLCTKFIFLINHMLRNILLFIKILIIIILNIIFSKFFIISRVNKFTSIFTPYSKYIFLSSFISFSCIKLSNIISTHPFINFY